MTEEIEPLLRMTEEIKPLLPLTRVERDSLVSRRRTDPRRRSGRLLLLGRRRGGRDRLERRRVRLDRDSIPITPGLAHGVVGDDLAVRGHGVKVAEFALDARDLGEGRLNVRRDRIPGDLVLDGNERAVRADGDYPRLAVRDEARPIERVSVDRVLRVF